MQTKFAIAVHRAGESRLSAEVLENPVFGQIAADHMFRARYRDEEWLSPEILPFQPLQLSPFTSCLHYAQTVFEGMKAFRTDSGSVNLFRPEKHYARFAASLERMAMPVVPYELFMESIDALLDIDRGWVPAGEGQALYVRPFVFASEAQLGARQAREFLFLVVCSPVGRLFRRPIRVRVETHFRRAAPGGTGATKCGGNYAGAFYPTRLAADAGFDQVLWTDGAADPGIEESGMMNVFFVLGDTLVTAPLSDTILDGITRDSLLTLAREAGWQTEERHVSASELWAASQQGTLKEAFGAGTAAVVASISEIVWGERSMPVPVPGTGSFQEQLRTMLEDIRHQRTEDRFGWNHII